VIVIKSENPNRKGGDLSVRESVITKVYFEQYFYLVKRQKKRLIIHYVIRGGEK